MNTMTLSKIFLTLAGYALLCLNAHALDVERIEPPHWWVGMKQSRLQLMVHGDAIATLSPEVRYPGVKLIGTERTNNPNYLFINLEITPQARAGAFDIAFKRGKERVATSRYVLQARQKGSSQRKGFDASDAVYLITPDRFSNGNAANDHHVGMVDVVDRTQPSARHGGDIQGMRNHLDYIKSMGFTMIWPTPLLENNQSQYSYHGYALTDYYRIDPRFGNNQDFKDFVQAANQQGMGVIQDIVVNHIGDGHWWMKDLPAHDWINSPSSRVQTNNRHLTVQDPHAAPEERQQFLDGWFVSSMPDLNQRNPLVARYLIQNTIWWLEYANLSGIREDTYSYADPQFLARWCNAILQEYPHINIVGEEMDDNPYVVAYWQKGAKNQDGYESGLPSLMDFPVVDAMPAVLTGPEGWNTGLGRLYELIASDFVYANPMNLMVFPDNHDRPRIYSLLNEDLDLFKTSMLFTATTRGIPQFYYGTEVLTKSPVVRDDGVLRADFPGGWPGDTVNAFTGQGLRPDQREAQSYLKKLLNWRQTHSAVTSGKLTHYLPQDSQYVYFRHDAKNRVMVILNKNPADTQLDLTRFQSMLQGRRSGTDVMTGAVVDLTAPLTLKAKTSIAIAVDR